MADDFRVEGADAFFHDLSEKVQSLEQFAYRPPLSTPVAVATVGAAPAADASAYFFSILPTLDHGGKVGVRRHHGAAPAPR